jgi:hypothetical protein
MNHFRHIRLLLVVLFGLSAVVPGVCAEFSNVCESRNSKDMGIRYIFPEEFLDTSFHCDQWNTIKNEIKRVVQYTNHKDLAPWETIDIKIYLDQEGTPKAFNYYGRIKDDLVQKIETILEKYSWGKINSHFAEIQLKLSTAHLIQINESINHKTTSTKLPIQQDRIPSSDLSCMEGNSRYYALDSNNALFLNAYRINQKEVPADHPLCNNWSNVAKKMVQMFKTSSTPLKLPPFMNITLSLDTLGRIDQMNSSFNTGAFSEGVQKIIKQETWQSFTEKENILSLNLIFHRKDQLIESPFRCKGQKGWYTASEFEYSVGLRMRKGFAEDFKDSLDFCRTWDQVKNDLARAYSTYNKTSKISLTNKVIIKLNSKGSVIDFYTPESEEKFAKNIERILKKYSWGRLKVNSTQINLAFNYRTRTIRGTDFYNAFTTRGNFADGIEEVLKRRVGKPIIYLYPESPIDLKLQLEFDGTIDYTYPSLIGHTWKVHALPSGDLINQRDHKTYYSLYWTGTGNAGVIVSDDTTGFKVHRDSIESFLEDKLSHIGLNYKEQQEFIIYWAPKMRKNLYNYVHFSFKKYAEYAKLKVIPIEPKTSIRFLMLFKKVNEDFEIEEQVLPSYERKGFTLVDWGGSNLDDAGLWVE